MLAYGASAPAAWREARYVKQYLGGFDQTGFSWLQPARNLLIHDSLRHLLRYQPQSPDAILEACMELATAPGWRLSALRTLVALHAVVVAIQAAMAGQFLSGVDSAVVLHEVTGWVVVAVCLLQLALAFAARKLGGGFAVLFYGTLVLLLAEIMQVGIGYGRFLGVHVPLGVFIFGGVIWQLGWILRV